MSVRSRTVEWADPGEMATRRLETDGLGYFSGIARGDIPPPPIYPFMNIGVEEVEKGRSRVSFEPSDQLYNPLGTIHGGVAATLLDTAMGIATQSTLDQGRTVVTMRLHVDYLRAMTADTGRLYCEGTVARAGRTVALTDGSIIDETGRIYCRGRATFMVMPARATNSATPPRDRARAFSWSDPTILTSAAPNMTSLELLTKMKSGDLPHPSICDTLDFRIADIERGRAAFECEVQEFHYNPMGGAHGGLAATLLDSTTGIAVHSTLDQGTGFTTVFLWTEFFKAMTVETGHIRCEGRVVREGGRVMIADAAVVDDAGAVYARGSSTCLKLPLG